MHAENVNIGYVRSPFFRFDENMEERYLHMIRRNNRLKARIVCIIGISFISLYILINFLLFNAEIVSQFIYPALGFIAIISIYYFVIGSDVYVKWQYIDIPFFIVIFEFQFILNKSYFSISIENGSSPTNIVAYNAAVAMFFMCIMIVGSFRAFILSASIVSMAVLTIIFNLGMPFNGQIWILTPYFTATILAIFANSAIDGRTREAFQLVENLEEQKNITENLLHNVLPKEIADRLRKGEVIADSFSEVAVIFIDIVGFSNLTKMVSPNHLVEILNRFFSMADERAGQFSIEKVKTIGDAYLAIAGSIQPVSNPAFSAIKFSLSVIEGVNSIKSDMEIELSVRVGIHTGSVIGGIIGTSRHSYDYWGDTMNIASRIQDVSNINGISVSETTFFRTKKDFSFSSPRIKTLKGVGEVKIFDVVC